MTLYTAFVLLTLTVLVMPIGYGEWKKNRAANGRVSSDHSHFRNRAARGNGTHASRRVNGSAGDRHDWSQRELLKERAWHSGSPKFAENTQKLHYIQ